METGTAQFFASIVAAIAAITVAIVGGNFTLQAARIQASKAAGSESTTNELSKGKVVLWLVLVGVLALPFSCVLGLIFNSLGSETLAEPYIVNVYTDSIDPTFVGAILGAIGFVLGVVISRLGILNNKK